MPFETPPVAAPSFSPPAPALPGPTVDAGSLISRTFSVWSKHLFLFAALSLVVVVPIVIVIGIAGAAMMGGNFSMSDGPSPGMIGLIVVIALPLVLAAVGVQLGGITCGTIQHLAGRPVRLGNMLSTGFGRVVPLVAATVLISLMVMGGMILLIVPGIMIACAVGVALPAIVAERLGPIEAIKRSFMLTRDYRTVFFVSTFAIGIVSFLMNMVGQVFQVALGQGIGTVLSLIVQLIVGPLGSVLPAVAYHDLRRLKEGAPTDELARVFE